MTDETLQKFKDGYYQGQFDTIQKVLEIIKTYKSYHNGAHWTLLKEIVGKIEELVEVTE